MSEKKAPRTHPALVGLEKYDVSKVVRVYPQGSDVFAQVDLLGAARGYECIVINVPVRRMTVREAELFARLLATAVYEAKKAEAGK